MRSARALVGLAAHSAPCQHHPIAAAIGEQIAQHRSRPVPYALMKMSVWPSNTERIVDILATARWAEDNGCFGFWIADHFMPNTGTVTVDDGAYFEAWGMIPAVAATTEHIRIGPLVSPTSVYHPALLANRAATIDHLSGGRFVLGLGAGWQINEHHAYGIELEPPKQRVDRFEEAIEIIRSLLNNPRTTFNGRLYTITDAPCEPKPVQHPMPLLVGTGSPRMMRVAARWADEWNTWGRPDISIPVRQRYAEACETVGTSIDTKHTSVNALVTITDDLELIDEASNAQSIVGPADRVIESIAAYRDAGFDEFIVPTWNLGEAVSQRLEALERIKAEVFDQL